MEIRKKNINKIAAFLLAFLLAFMPVVSSISLPSAFADESQSTGSGSAALYYQPVMMAAPPAANPNPTPAPSIYTGSASLPPTYFVSSPLSIPAPPVVAPTATVTGSARIATIPSVNSPSTVSVSTSARDTDPLAARNLRTIEVTVGLVERDYPLPDGSFETSLYNGLIGSDGRTYINANTFFREGPTASVGQTLEALRNQEGTAVISDCSHSGCADGSIVYIHSISVTKEYSNPATPPVQPENPLTQEAELYVECDQSGNGNIGNCELIPQEFFTQIWNQAQEDERNASGPGPHGFGGLQTVAPSDIDTYATENLSGAAGYQFQISIQSYTDALQWDPYAWQNKVYGIGVPGSSSQLPLPVITPQQQYTVSQNTRTPATTVSTNPSTNTAGTSTATSTTNAPTNTVSTSTTHSTATGTSNALSQPVSDSARMVSVVYDKKSGPFAVPTDKEITVSGTAPAYVGKLAPIGSGQTEVIVEVGKNLPPDPDGFLGRPAAGILNKANPAQFDKFLLADKWPDSSFVSANRQYFGFVATTDSISIASIYDSQTGATQKLILQPDDFGPDQVVQSTAVSSEGNLVLLIRNNSSSQSVLKIFRVPDGKVLKEIAINGNPDHMVADSGKLILYANIHPGWNEPVLRVWVVNTGDLSVRETSFSVPGGNDPVEYIPGANSFLVTRLRGEDTLIYGLDGSVTSLGQALQVYYPTPAFSMGLQASNGRTAKLIMGPAYSQSDPLGLILVEDMPDGTKIVHSRPLRQVLQQLSGNNADQFSIWSWTIGQNLTINYSVFEGNDNDATNDWKTYTTTVPLNVFLAAFNMPGLPAYAPVVESGMTTSPLPAPSFPPVIINNAPVQTFIASRTNLPNVAVASQKIRNTVTMDFGSGLRPQDRLVIQNEAGDAVLAACSFTGATSHCEANIHDFLPGSPLKAIIIYSDSYVPQMRFPVRLNATTASTGQPENGTFLNTWMDIPGNNTGQIILRPFGLDPASLGVNSNYLQQPEAMTNTITVKNLSYSSTTDATTSKVNVKVQISPALNGGTLVLNYWKGTLPTSAFSGDFSRNEHSLLLKCDFAGNCSGEIAGLPQTSSLIYVGELHYYDAYGQRNSVLNAGMFKVASLPPLVRPRPVSEAIFFQPADGNTASIQNMGSCLYGQGNCRIDFSDRYAHPNAQRVNGFTPQLMDMFYGPFTNSGMMGANEAAMLLKLMALPVSANISIANVLGVAKFADPGGMGTSYRLYFDKALPVVNASPSPSATPSPSPASTPAEEDESAEISATLVAQRQLNTGDGQLPVFESPLSKDPASGLFVTDFLNSSDAKKVWEKTKDTDDNDNDGSMFKPGTTWVVVAVPAAVPGRRANMTVSITPSDELKVEVEYVLQGTNFPNSNMFFIEVKGKPGKIKLINSPLPQVSDLIGPPPSSENGENGDGSDLTASGTTAATTSVNTEPVQTITAINDSPLFDVSLATVTAEVPVAMQPIDETVEPDAITQLISPSAEPSETSSPMFPMPPAENKNEDSSKSASAPGIAFSPLTTATVSPGVLPAATTAVTIPATTATPVNAEPVQAAATISALIIPPLLLTPTLPVNLAAFKPVSTPAPVIAAESLMPVTVATTPTVTDTVVSAEPLTATAEVTNASMPAPVVTTVATAESSANAPADSIAITSPVLPAASEPVTAEAEAPAEAPSTEPVVTTTADTPETITAAAVADPISNSGSGGGGLPGSGTSPVLNTSGTGYVPLNPAVNIGGGGAWTGGDIETVNPLEGTSTVQLDAGNAVKAEPEKEMNDLVADLNALYASEGIAGVNHKLNGLSPATLLELVNNAAAFLKLNPVILNAVKLKIKKHKQRPEPANGKKLMQDPDQERRKEKLIAAPKIRRPADSENTVSNPSAKNDPPSW